MPGLAAGPEIFENLKLSSEIFDLNYLTWKDPINLEESLEDYTKRITEEITHKNPVLIGVSFGGILVQEISKIIAVKKVIIISSVKTMYEFPTSFKLANTSKIYKLFPTQIVDNFEDYTKFFIGKSLQKKAELYKKYLSVRGNIYLKWSIYNVLNWQQETPLENITHIQGTKDHIFPLKNIKNAIEIKDGTHAMVLIKAKQISKIIHETLTC